MMVRMNLEQSPTFPVSRIDIWHVAQAMPTNSCYDQKKRRSKLEQNVLRWALDNAVGSVT